MSDLDEPGIDVGDALRRTVVPSGTRPHTSRRRQVDGAEAGGTWATSPVAYELEGRPEPPPIPNGWYSIVSSHDLGPGEIRSIIAVGRELVVFRPEAGGPPTVADAHCPHLGAHLGGGWVSEDTIHCPYHGWRFDTSGTCVEIPYGESRIPSRACLRTYEVREQDGFVFAWYHAAGAPPAYEIPAVPEVGDPAFSGPHPWHFELTAALQEMAENNVDYAHLHVVHRRETVPDDVSTFTTDGPFSKVVELLPDGTEFYRETFGPGIAVLRVPNMMTVLTTTTPIDRRHCRLNWHFHVAAPLAHLADDMVAGVTGEYGLMADVPIWRDKVFLERPVLVKGDGNIAEFRRWYAQFYDAGS